MKVAREIMSSPAEIINTTDKLGQAAEKMARCGLGALPICDKDGILKGVLTDRDIVINALNGQSDPKNMQVSKFCTGKPVTIGADDSLDEAIETMEEYKVRRLPVVDGHKLVGMLSLGDLSEHIDTSDAGELLRTLSEAP